MSQHRKHRGYQSQAIVAQWFTENGWPYAQPVGAGRTGSDITGVPFDVEVKARRGFPVGETLAQLAARNEGTLAFAVLRPDGMGPASIGNWPVVITLAAFTDLLTAAQVTQ